MLPSEGSVVWAVQSTVVVLEIHSVLSLSATPLAATAGRMCQYGKSLVLGGNFEAGPWAREA